MSVQVIEAGGHLFTGSVAPGAGSADPAAQSGDVYGRIRAALAAVDPGAAVIRLDHLTSSQSWLAARQAVRAEHFGKPMPAASTGIPAALPAGCSVTVAAVAALSRGPAPVVVVPGADFGMPFIAGAVRSGDLLTVSGILGDERAAAAAGVDQAELCAQNVAEILLRCAAGGVVPRPARLDVYARDERVLRRFDELAARYWPGGEVSVARAVMPMSPGNDLEVTCLAAGSAAWRFSGEHAGAVMDGDIVGRTRSVLRLLSDDLASSGADGSDLVRLDVAVADAGWEGDVRAGLRAELPAARPVLVLRPSGPVGGADLRVTAIAYRD